MTCEFTGCGRKIQCLNKFCLAHYKQFKATGQLWPLGTRRPVEKILKFCDAPACDREFYARGKCVSHWARIRDGYEPDAPIRGQEGYWHPCALPGCGRDASHRHNVCQPHRERAKTYGITPERLLVFWGDGSCKSCGSFNKPSIHHDHNCCAKTPACGNCVVALLCAMCNKAAGMVGDDPEKLRRLADVIDLTSANRS